MNCTCFNGMEREKTTVSESNPIVESILTDLNEQADVSTPFADEYDYLVQLQRDKFDSDLDYGRRDAIYTQILRNYVGINKSKARWNKGYKLAFFIVIVLIMLALTGGPISVFIILALKSDITASEITLIAGCTVGMLSAIVVLPKIIAEHLFPMNEDEHMIEMVKNMQENDSKIRDTLEERHRRQHNDSGDPSMGQRKQTPDAKDKSNN